MRRNYTRRQNTAGIIRYSCGILFLLFTFFYLYCLQGEILAEAQHVYSGGLTTYNLFIGALIISVVLQVVQWIVAKASRVPPMWHAVTYLPSMLMLAMLTDENRDTILRFDLGAWVWVAPLVLVLYVVVVIATRTIVRQSADRPKDLRQQLYPNYIILFIMTLCVGAIPQSTDVFHFELKAERLVLDHDYEAASRVGERSLRASARLTQLRMYALSKQGLLAERLFDYPQHYGSRGLLDVTDTLSSYRLSPQAICLHLGAFCGSSIHTTERYYQLMLADTIYNQNTVDYYLCSLLLDKRLADFGREVRHYYNLADSIPEAVTGLPRAYREALLLLSPESEARKGIVVVGSDTLGVVSDSEMLNRLKDYQQMKHDLSDPVERINRTHREFGTTYWWYYDYSHKAKGELNIM